MSFIFDKSSLNKRFKIWFKPFLESIPVQKTVSEALKTCIFFILHFGWLANEEAIAPCGPLGCVTIAVKNKLLTFCPKISKHK